MNRRRALLLVVLGVVVGAVVAVLVVLAVRKDGDGKVAGPATTTTTTAPLSDTAKELIERLKAGGSRTFRASYSGTASEGVTLTVDVWRKGGLARQDVVLASAGVTNELRALRLSDGTAACQRVAGADWVCQRTATAAASSDAAGVFDAAVANLNAKVVTATDQRVADRDARCYSIAGAEGTVEICVTPDGLPVRLSSSGSQIVLSGYDPEVPDDAFTPPAPLTAPTTAN